MNKIKLVIFSLLVLTVGMVIKARAIDPDSYITFELSAPSATVFTGGGYVLGVSRSSAATADGADYFVFYNTQSPTSLNVPGIASYTDRTQRKIAPLVFYTTPTATNSGDQEKWFPSPGIYCSTGAFAIKTSTAIGEAYRVIIYWKR